MELLTKRNSSYPRENLAQPTSSAKANGGLTARRGPE